MKGWPFPLSGANTNGVGKSQGMEQGMTVLQNAYTNFKTLEQFLVS